jgi:hypothetical protein
MEYLAQAVTIYKSTIKWSDTIHVFFVSLGGGFENMFQVSGRTAIVMATIVHGKTDTWPGPEGPVPRPRINTEAISIVRVVRHFPFRK